jgi:hypothetical protein
MEAALRKAELGVAALLTSVVVYLHILASTSAGGLWRDEANTVGLATLPKLGDVARNLQYDSFPILWLVVVREYATVVGSMNDPAFRVLGSVVGIGVVAALWFIAREVGHSLPLVSLPLLAMSPSLILWGDSMRAYGFGILLILITGGLLWRFVEQPTRRRFIAALLVSVASVHTLFYNSVLLLAFGAGAVAVCVMNRAWRTGLLVVVIGGVAAASMLPYVSQIRDASSWNALVREPDYSFAWFWLKLEETVRPAGPWALTLWFFLFILAVVTGVGAVRYHGKLGLSRKQREVALFSVVTLIVGVPAIMIFLNTLSYYTQPWYYLTLLAMAGVCIDAVLGALMQDRSARIFRLIGASLLAVATLFPAARAARVRHTNVDLISDRLNTVAEPGDIVLVAPWYNGVSFSRYYRGSARWETVPGIGFHRFHRYDLIKLEMMRPDQFEAVRTLVDNASNALRAGHRVFVVASIESLPSGQPPRVLAPAPSPGRPWPSAQQYSVQWASMVGYHLQQHATTVVRLSVGSRGEVSGYENLALVVAKGWRP